MAKPLTPDQIIAALRKWHVPYIEYAGWRTRGRPGGITDVVGMLQHHTGGGSPSASYLAFLFKEGRPAEGIPGPLCNVATSSAGVVYLGAIGRANHAGSGSSATMAKVEAENYNGYTEEIKPGSDGTNGNPHYYGNEWIYSGTVVPDPRQVRAAVLWTAALCDAHGWSALSSIAHREHTRRKNDPYGVKMPTFRGMVRKVLQAGPGATTNYVATGNLGTTTTPQTPTTPPKAGLTVSEYTDLRDQINLRAAEIRQEVRRQAIWQLRYGVQIADDLETAADVYDAAIKAGQTPEQAEAAYQASISEISADLANRAQQNG